MSLLYQPEHETAESREPVLEPAPTTPSRRRPSRRLVLGALASVVVIVAALVVIVGDDPPDEEVAVAAAEDDDDTTSTTARRATSTSSTTVDTTSVVATETTVATTTTSAPAVAVAVATTAPRRTTTTAPTAPTPTAPTPTAPTLPAHCRNSTDPDCGPFFWDPPQPPNQPLTIAFADLPSRWNRFDGGMPVRFEWSDADGWWMSAQLSIDGTPVAAPRCPEDQGYGPWTPVDPQPTSHSGIGQLNDVYFEAPGMYTLVLGVGTWGCGWAGRSHAVITATVEVYDDPPPPEEPSAE